MGFLKKLTQWLQKYRYAVLILVIGLVFMLFPTKSQDTEQTEESAETVSESMSLAQQLEELLATIQGVGDVKVLLTVAAGEEILYQYDEKTVLVTDENKGETGLVRQIIPQTYLGAVIACQGADSASVRLAVVEAVSAVTGLSTDRITVLKMK